MNILDYVPDYTEVIAPSYCIRMRGEYGPMYKLSLAKNDGGCLVILQWDDLTFNKLSPVYIRWNSVRWQRIMEGNELSYVYLDDLTLNKALWQLEQDILAEAVLLGG